MRNGVAGLYRWKKTSYGSGSGSGSDSGAFTAAVFVASDADAAAGVAEEEAAAAEEEMEEEVKEAEAVEVDGVAGERCSGVLWPAGINRRALNIEARHRNRHQNRNRAWSDADRGAVKPTNQQTKKIK